MVKSKDTSVERDISGETVCGFRVAAWRETHPEHGDKYGHSYSEHWSTPNSRDPRVKVERLFTEDQLRTLISERVALRKLVERFKRHTKNLALTDNRWGHFARKFFITLEPPYATREKDNG
jgi:hypothetical protein